MYSHEIDQIAKKCLGSSFIGVYPLDMLPSYLSDNTGFIVNTQSHTLPGEHWLAVFKRYGKIYAYDPIGIYYPSFLVTYLQKLCPSGVNYNKKTIQQMDTNTCGQHCIEWMIEQVYKENITK